MAIITFSREVGSLGTEIAKKVKDNFGLNFLDKEVLEKELTDRYGLSPKKIERYDEKGPSLWDFSLDKERHLHYIKSAMFEFALKGSCILIGRGGQVLFTGFPDALHIRIIAPRDLRIERIRKRYDCSDKIAERILSQSDRNREAFHKFFFFSDWNDRNLYDLVINTRSIDVDAAAGMIGNFIEKTKLLDRKQEEKDRLSDICLSNSIVSKIRYEENIGLQYLDVETLNGTATLRGITSDAEDIEKSVHIAEKVPGVKKVINEIAVYKYPQV
jgi:cytidylate kinase